MGKDLLKLSYKEVRKIRGNDMAMIFQEPMTSLNPVFSIGMQIMEPILLHQGKNKKEARKIAADMLELVGIPSAETRLDDYPHQFSGGMRQRVMIAIALACNPVLLIADEPTTALDVTIQAQILTLMLDIKKKRPEAAMLLITHDLAVVAETCQRAIVMYGGKIQEVADIVSIFKKPLHPYTKGLLKSLPHPDKKVKRLDTIRGMVPNIMSFPAGCKFCTRCDDKIDICDTIEPELIDVGDGHMVRCHLVKKEN